MPPAPWELAVLAWPALIPTGATRSSSDTQQRSRPSLQDPVPDQSSPRSRGLSLLPLIPN